MAVVTDAPPRHSCLLVDDIDAAIADLTANAAMPFGPIQEMPMRMVGSGTEATEIVRFCYSLDGLVELGARGVAGIFGAAEPPGIHHVGHISDVDLDLAVERHEALGDTVEWQVFVDDWLLAVFITPTATRPVRLELVAPDVASRFG